LLQGTKPAGHLGWIGWGLAPQDVQLDVHAQQGLQDAVVNVAGDAAALPFNGMRSKVAKEKQILERLPEVPDNSLKPLQILRDKAAACIPKQEPAYGLPPEVESHSENGAPPQLLPHGTRESRQVLKAAPILPIPAEPVAGAFKLVPTDAGVWLVEQETITSGYGKVFGRKAGIVSGQIPPHKNALEIDVSERQDCLVARECTNEFSKDQPQGLRHSTVDFDQAGEMGKKPLLGCVLHLAAADQWYAYPGGERSSGKRNPGQHRLPNQRTIYGRPDQ
jgi:hypothetical protein